MKKILLLTGFLFGTIIISPSCSNNDVENNDQLSCVEKMAKYSDIAGAAALKYYNVEMTTSSCITYREAIEDYISKTENCPNNEVIVESYLIVLENLNCD